MAGDPLAEFRLAAAAFVQAVGQAKVSMEELKQAVLTMAG